MHRPAIAALLVSVLHLAAARAGAHDEMAAAAAAQIEAFPAPAVLPVLTGASTRAAAASPDKKPPHAQGDLGRRAADQAQQGQGQGQGQGQALGLARHARDAAMSAAGQGQAAAAKQRAATHPHPTH